MTVRELPVRDQPEVLACCAPLSAEVLTAPDAATLAKQFAALTAEGGAVCACDRVEPAGRTQGTVSFHLGKLRDAGVVMSEKRGRKVWYAVNPAALEALRGALATR